MWRRTTAPNFKYNLIIVKGEDKTASIQSWEFDRNKPVIFITYNNGKSYPYNLDYMHLFQIVHDNCANKDEVYEVFRRMCFNVLYGNRDDHGKNFSFIFDERIKSYSLSPAYDLTRVMDKPEHEMTILGNGKPDESNLLTIANTLKLSNKKSLDIIEIVKLQVSKY